MPELRYKQLVDRFAADIREGRLRPGTRLPTHRDLAAREGLALVTATRVYAELQVMGLVSGETGRGTFVKEPLPRAQVIDLAAWSADTVDLSFNYPSLPNQTDLFRAALRQLAAAGDLESMLRYQPHGGREHERATAARHLASQGLNETVETTLLVSGAQHGLTTTAMALLEPGDVVAVDALTYPGRRDQSPGTCADPRRRKRPGPGRVGDALQTAASARRLRDADTAQSARLGDERDAAPGTRRHRATAWADPYRGRGLRVPRASRTAAARIACAGDNSLCIEPVEKCLDRAARRLHPCAGRMDSQARTNDSGDNLEHPGDHDGDRVRLDRGRHRRHA